MRIAVDIREAASPHRAGKGEYADHLVRALLALDGGHEYLLLSDENAFSLPAGANARVRRLRAPGWRWHLAAMQAALEARCDRFFAPTSYLVPALAGSRLPTVVTVCDLVAFLFPDTHRRRSVEIEQATLGAAVHSARAVLCISQQTKRDLVDRFPEVEPKVHLTLCANAAAFTQAIRPSEVEATRARLKLPKRYVLAVGTLEPRKNLPLLARAHARARKRLGDLELVLVGKPGWGIEGFTAELDTLGTRDAVHFTGYLPQADLPQVYAAARAFAFPSRYEGFGIPPLEAMASGCPVISSNAASLPEVVGDAGVMLDPDDEAGWAEALIRVDQDAALRARLVKQGKARAATFRWRDSAREAQAALVGSTPE